jgi:hypothetical protein
MHGKGCCVFASGAMCDLIESLAPVFPASTKSQNSDEN